MKKLFALVLSTVFVGGLLSIHTAAADCVYPDVCTGSLQRFGEDRSEVLPDDGGYQGSQSMSNKLFSPQEEFQMLKNIVLRSRRYGDNGQLRRSVQGGTTPYNYINRMQVTAAVQGVR